MDILEKAMEMPDVVHLAIGEPDFDTPRPIKEGAMAALSQKKINYTHSLGMRELRQEIADYYQRQYQVTISPDQIAVTSGTSPALMLAVAVLFRQSQKKEFLLANPGYACYPNFINFMNGQVIYYDLDAENGFRPEISAIRPKISRETAGIMVNSPSNPTGVVLNPAECNALAELDIPIVSDEIYQGLVYEGPKFDTMLRYTRNVIVLNGFSKLFAMTGWRLGYAIFPESSMGIVQKLCQNLFISANTVAQWAALTALRDPRVAIELQAMVAEYDQRRQFALAELQKYNLRVAARPAGAYYIIVDVREYSQDSLQLTYEILENARVAVGPGIDFGSNLEGYIRISYATAKNNLQEGIRRLGEYLLARKGR
jgi:aspartate/methionine/tyrosine aminotransferase